MPTSRTCLVWGLWLFFLGCAANQGCREEPSGPPTVILQGVGGQDVRVRVEVVAREQERARGLMHRRQLAPDAGMLFVYYSEDQHSFWMKNTYIPLDLIFIGANRRVVGLIQNTTPLSLESLRVEAPSRYILEVNAGFAALHKIREDSPVRFSGISQVP